MELIHYASAADDVQGLAKLLSRSLRDVNARDEDGRTPLHHAAIHGHVDCALLLLEHNADIEARDNRGRTPLISAVYDEILVIERGTIMRALLSNGARVDAHDLDGDTALHLAAGFDEREAMSILVHNGANSNALNNSGDTPLHCAVWFAGTEKVRLLLMLDGINVNIKNGRGLTPKQAAEANGLVDLVELLGEFEHRSVSY